MASYKKAYKKHIVEEIKTGISIDTICNREGLKKVTVKKWEKEYSLNPTVFDEVPFDSIKEELQGNNIIKTLKPEFIGSTSDMAELALATYERQIGHSLTATEILADTDEILKTLISTENELFQDKISRFGENILPLYYDKYYGKPHRYIHMEELMAALLKTYDDVQNNNLNVREFIDQVSKIIIPASNHIATSNSQSAKSRAGAALENHLAALMDKCGFKFDRQEKIEDGETIADFFLPNKDAVRTNPSMVLNIECQTTLKDRHRLTTGKSTDQHIQRYLATGTGIGLFTKKDINDFTFEKLKELIIINNIQVVVFAEVKTRLVQNITDELNKRAADPTHLGKVSTVELQTLLSRSSGSLISYTELFNQRILPYMGVWQASGIIQ